MEVTEHMEVSGIITAVWETALPLDDVQPALVLVELQAL